jgi:hypothetical protein
MAATRQELRLCQLEDHLFTRTDHVRGRMHVFDDK